MNQTESLIFAIRSSRPRVFSKIMLVASSIAVVSAFVSHARASDYNVAIGDGYQGLSRTPTGPGFGFLFDATRSGGAYSIGPGLSFGVPLGAVSLTAAGKALYVRSADGRSGLATPVGVIARIRTTPSLSLVGRAFYTPRSAFNAGLGAYTQASAGVRWAFKPINLEAGWRYEELKGRNGAQNTRLTNGPYIAAGFSF
ncbi:MULTISPECIES: YfaZ family outer membrane protein [Burkholderia]|uniref:YfaZ family outer membrane protein n=1 Tax=Burkholderia TaxID=32008 RepID=UPI000A43DF5A|nr:MULTISPECIES: YfaZ family outer membrane protein [Burkholderia]